MQNILICSTAAAAPHHRAALVPAGTSDGSPAIYRRVYDEKVNRPIGDLCETPTLNDPSSRACRGISFRERCDIFLRLILRQAQDDRILKESLKPRSQTPFGNAIVSAIPLPIPCLSEENRREMEFREEQEDAPK